MKSFNSFLIEATSKAKKGMQHAVDVAGMMDAHDEHTSKGIDSILSGLEQEHSRIHS